MNNVSACWIHQVTDARPCTSSQVAIETELTDLLGAEDTQDATGREFAKTMEDKKTELAE